MEIVWAPAVKKLFLNMTKPEAEQVCGLLRFMRDNKVTPSQMENSIFDKFIEEKLILKGKDS